MAQRQPSLTDVVLVVDTGVDDALALLLALRSTTLRVRGVACVAGNVPVDRALANTLRVLDVAGAGDIRIGRGTAAGPVSGRREHGTDGMADLGIRASTRTPPRNSIADVLQGDDPYTVLSLAPCTDLAPVIGPPASRIIAVAGFNRDHDPSAFDAVVGCGVPAVVYDLPVLQQARVTAADADRLAGSADPVASLGGRLLQHQVRRGGGRSGSIGDAIAVAALLTGTIADPQPSPCVAALLSALTGPAAVQNGNCERESGAT